jgi:hypothetical protein
VCTAGLNTPYCCWQQSGRLLAAMLVLRRPACLQDIQAMVHLHLHLHLHLRGC